jgi:spermidine/putrescine transport system permease protein
VTLNDCRDKPLTLKRHKASRGALLIVPAMAWVFVFTVVPVTMLVVLSFWTSTAYGIKPDWTTDNYRTIFSEYVYLSTFLRTLRIAAVTTLLTLIIAYPMALILARMRSRRKAVVLLIVFLPFWTSYVVRSFLWLPMLGRNGLLNFILIKAGIVSRPVDWFLYNEGAVYIGLVYAYMLFMFLPIFQSLDKQDRKLEEAAGDLGATPFQAFRRVVLPLSLPGVFSGCIMVFLFACGAYVTPQLLGGASALMVGNVIGSQFQVSNNWALGAALSTTLMAAVGACFAISAWRLGLLQLLSGRQK